MTARGSSTLHSLAVVTAAIITLTLAGPQAHAIVFSDADATAYIDFDAITVNFAFFDDAPAPGPFGPFPDFDEINHHDQGAFTTTWDGGSTFVDDDDSNFSTTEFDGSVHALSHSDSPFAPVFADAAADATNAGISALTSVGFDTEGSAHAYRDVGGTFHHEGILTLEIPYKISYGTIPFLPDDVLIFTEVLSTITVWDEFNNPFFYYSYDYFWHTSILGDGDVFNGTMTLEPEFFDGEQFLMTHDVYTVIVIDDGTPEWEYPTLLEDLINGVVPDNGGGSGAPPTRHNVPEPATALVLLVLAPLMLRRQSN